MRPFALTLALAGTLLFAACEEKTAEAPPPPQQLTASSTGHYCGMNVLEHSGPKGQIILASQKEPVWFSSARDAFSFTMLPEEPKDVRAVYVSDMSKAPSWDRPGEANWVDAKQAFFVIGSRIKGGMGAEETVPFSDKAAAEKFAAEQGGHIVSFDEMPRQYVLGSGSDTAPAPDAATHSGHGAATPDHAPGAGAAKHGH